MPDERQLAQLHHHLLRGIIEQYSCPSNPELADRLGLSVEKVETLLRDLAAIHGVVLHPHVCEPWIVHPFSLTPTLNWVEGRRGGWWAPCIWCALGVAVLVGGETRIHTRIGAEAESVVVPVAAGEPIDLTDLWVHFAIPPQRAWQNVHQHCALVLPFRSPQAIREWCAKYKVAQGEVVPLQQVAALARRWYGTHADPAWHKWSIAEAREIFRRAGFTSEFWDLGPATGNF